MPVLVPLAMALSLSSALGCLQVRRDLERAAEAYRRDVREVTAWLRQISAHCAGVDSTPGPVAPICPT